MPGVSSALTVDVHQHLWPPELVAALRARRRPPRLRGWVLELTGQPDYAVDASAHDPSLRAAEAIADGLDLALLAPSGPLGIEFLAPDEGRELLDAYHEGVLALGEPFGAWAGACLTDVDPDALERELDRGFVGLQLPATALLGAAGYERARPLLDLLERRGRALLVHPGPAEGASAGDPEWWPPLVDYVQQMHAAWFAFRVNGRPVHPRLRVCFAMLAGLAPLHGERFAARTGMRSVLDENAFLDVSSYGARAVDATARVLGVDVLVNGSDRPYAAPMLDELGAAELHAVRSANPKRLLNHKEVLHGVAVPAGSQS
jgi:hypothetical protein